MAWRGQLTSSTKVRKCTLSPPNPFVLVPAEMLFFALLKLPHLCFKADLLFPGHSPSLLPLCNLQDYFCIFRTQDPVISHVPLIIDYVHFGMRLKSSSGDLKNEPCSQVSCRWSAQVSTYVPTEAVLKWEMRPQVTS